MPIIMKRSIFSLPGLLLAGLGNKMTTRELHKSAIVACCHSLALNKHLPTPAPAWGVSQTLLFAWGSPFLHSLSSSTSQLHQAKNKCTASRPPNQSILQTSPFLCATTCQMGVLKLFINAHTNRKRARALCCPVVHHLLFLFFFLVCFYGFS